MKTFGRDESGDQETMKFKGHASFTPEDGGEPIDLGEVEMELVLPPVASKRLQDIMTREHDAAFEYGASLVAEETVSIDCPRVGCSHVHKFELRGARVSGESAQTHRFACYCGQRVFLRIPASAKVLSHCIIR
jgi:hypothetical protein